ncbi:MAG: nitrite reductase small subunit NirD [Hoeflea sp.]|uniref:nitrite reductase small subunit NirD n=1 Tax=Hoeflea sp. TaxID=1940281 RepID=UPI0027302927|nr:nitrite reductase small subunit NirD [Hoeflea sp.]MDP2121970.1 nitrite reductase small subunit NirD [Hoeflea sp.]MDP3524816.1 nitrite reductase small subunit NirD [Hoeflea sp.]
MNALTQTWVRIGKIGDIPRRGARCVKHGDMSIAIFRTADDRVFALEDKCPHKNGPLSQGIVHDGCVTCPLHNWVISLETGAAQGADEGRTLSFPVRLEGDEIVLGLGAPA